MNVAALIVGAYDNAELSIQGSRPADGVFTGATYCDRIVK